MSGKQTMRNMSFALTTAQIRNRTKTVTRRLGWTFLKPGDLVRAVVKAQGLKKGEKVEPLATLRIVGVRQEQLDDLETKAWPYGETEVLKEGFANHPQFGSPGTFVDMFCDTHECEPYAAVTRIEFEYV
jgi:hypothetical protein